MALEKQDKFIPMIFDETNQNIRYQKEGTEIWICAKDLALALQCSEDRLRYHYCKFGPKHKRIITVSQTHSDFRVNKLTFLNKKGLIKLLGRLQAPDGSLIDRFQDWVADKIDELITTGQTSLHDRRLEIFNNFCNFGREVISSETSEEKIKTLTKMVANNTMKRLDNQEQTPNNDIPMTIESRLVLKHGVYDAYFIRLLSSKIGRKAAKKYRELYDKEPEKSQEDVWEDIEFTGKKYHVTAGINIYDPEIYNEWLDELIESTITEEDKIQITIRKQ